MRVRNRPDFISGLLFTFIGIGFAIVSRSYDMGTVKEIGPGYFPFLLGSILAVLGLVVALKSLSAKTAEVSLRRWSWRPVSWISVSILSFALALPSLGLLAAIALMSGTSLFAAEEKRPWKETLILVPVLMAFAYFVFVKGLHLQFPVFPVFTKLG